MRNIKNTILSIATSLALGASATFAGPFDGRFVGQENGMRFDIQLAEQQGTVRGVVAVNGQRFELQGKSDGRSIRGYIKGAQGDLPFGATMDNGQFVMITQQGEMRCTPAGGTPSPQTPANDGKFQQPQAPSMNDRPQVAMHNGKFFSYALPAGWTIDESQNAVILSSPDRSMCTTATGLVGMYGEATPASFLANICQLYKVQGVQVISSQQVQPPQGYQSAATFELALTGADGVQYRGQALSAVVSGGGRHSGSCITVMTRADKWESARTWLPQVALSVNASNTDLGAGAMANAARPLPSSSGGASLNHSMGDWKPYDASASNDRLSRANSDATRGYEQMIDNTTGQRYYPGANAYDASRGGYVNPERPTELLERVPDGQ